MFWEFLIQNCGQDGNFFNCVQAHRYRQEIYRLNAVKKRFTYAESTRFDRVAQTINVTRGAICQRLKAMGKIQKYGKWVPHKWKIEKPFVKCCFKGSKGNICCIESSTGDKKLIYFENPKRKKSWLSPGEVGPSTPRPNRFGRKTMLCVWWD